MCASDIQAVHSTRQDGKDLPPLRRDSCVRTATCSRDVKRSMIWHSGCLHSASPGDIMVERWARGRRSTKRTRGVVGKIGLKGLHTCSFSPDIVPDIDIDIDKTKPICMFCAASHVEDLTGRAIKTPTGPPTVHARRYTVEEQSLRVSKTLSFLSPHVYRAVVLICMSL